MKNLRTCLWVLLAFHALVLSTGCKVPAETSVGPMTPLPTSFGADAPSDSVTLKWNDFFQDPYLQALIDTAIRNNPDMMMTLQEIEVARNEAKMAKGFLFPKVEGGLDVGTEKVGRYTSQGAGDASTDMTPGHPVPEILPDYRVGFLASWEIDVRGKLRNMRKSAAARYLASVEGKNFVTTSLVAEVAETYYELLSLDEQLRTIQEAIRIQSQELEVVKAQKEAAKVSELAVKQFEAQWKGTMSREAATLQQITICENKINYLLGRYPQPVERAKNTFLVQGLPAMQVGIPSGLLANRPDIRQAEWELKASRFNVKVARAEFYPQIVLTAGVGLQSFNTKYLFSTPQSLAFSVAGGLVAPLINRSAIRSEFNKATALQNKAMYNYQRAVLNGFVEVTNGLSNIKQLENQNKLRSEQVETLQSAIGIADQLFRSAHADYLEVLTVQREALEMKLEWIDTRNELFRANIRLYESLGGGWN